MQVWNVLHVARWNTGRKKLPKICHLGTITQLCRAVSLQLRRASTIRKKLVKQQYLLHMSLQYGELQPTNGWDRFGSLGNPSKFQWVSHLDFIAATTSLTGGQPNFVRCLGISWDVWASLGLAYYIYTFGGSCPPPDGSWPCAKLTLRPSLAFSYIGTITVRHSSSGHQPNIAAW